MIKLESDFESLESILRSKIFALESVVYSDACRSKLLQFKNELKDLKKNVSKHFR